MINDFKIKYQPDSFYEKLYLSFFLEEEKYYLEADFHIRTEKEYEDFFHSYEIKNQEDQVIYWQNFSPKVLKEVYEYIRNKIDQENDFIDYHYTGEIKESAYKNMNIDYSIDKLSLIHI